MVDAERLRLLEQITAFYDQLRVDLDEIVTGLWSWPIEDATIAKLRALDVSRLADAAQAAALLQRRLADMRGETNGAD